jgi:hypothetical protein
VLELVVSALELPVLAVGSDQPVPQLPDLGGSVVGGDRQECFPDRFDGFLA